MTRFLEFFKRQDRRLLLADFIDASMPLDEEQQAEFDRQLETERFKGIKAMIMSLYDKGCDHGRREILAIQMEARFGPLQQITLQRLQLYPAERLSDLARALVVATSLRDLGLDKINLNSSEVFTGVKHV